MKRIKKRVFGGDKILFKAVDMTTGQDILCYKTNSVKDFDEFFTKPMRRKML